MTSTQRTLTTVAELKALHDVAYTHINALQEAVDSALLSQDDADANASDLHEALELHAIFSKLGELMTSANTEVVEAAKHETAGSMEVFLPCEDEDDED